MKLDFSWDTIFFAASFMLTRPVAAMPLAVITNAMNINKTTISTFLIGSHLHSSSWVATIARRRSATPTISPCSHRVRGSEQ